jgi:hypothetical protein
MSDENAAGAVTEMPKKSRTWLTYCAVVAIIAAFAVAWSHLSGRHITECGISKAGNPYAKVRVFKPFAGMGFTDKDHEIVEFHYPGRRTSAGDTVIHLPKVSGIEHVTVYGGNLHRIPNGDPSKLTCVMKPWTT